MTAWGREPRVHVRSRGLLAGSRQSGPGQLRSRLICAHVGRPRSPLTFSKADITSFGSADRYGGWKPVIRMRSVSAPHRWHDLLDVTTAWCVGKAPTISVNRTVPRTRSASTLWGTPVRNSSISPVIVSASLSHKVSHARLAKARGDDLCREAARRLDVIPRERA
jgi:hypothetical protein